MPYCRKCGFEMAEDDAFCRKCGASAESEAPKAKPFPNDILDPVLDPFLSFFNQQKVKDRSSTTRSANVATKESTSSRSEHQSKPREVYAGTVHKCPRCGEPMDWDDAHCPACGWELRDAGSVGSSDVFNQKLMDLQREIEAADAKKLPFFRYKEEEKVRMKVDLIRTFAIPNTEEDLVEFAILAASNMEDTRPEIAQAWQAKLQQADDKAEFLFPGTPEREKIRRLANRPKEKEAAKNREFWIMEGALAAFVLLMLFLSMIMGK